MRPTRSAAAISTALFFSFVLAGSAAAADDFSLLKDPKAEPASRRQALKSLAKAQSPRLGEALSVALAAEDSDLRGLALLQLDKMPTSAAHFEAVVALLGHADPDLALQADELVRDKYLSATAKQYQPKLDKLALDPSSPVSRSPYVLSRLAELAMAQKKTARAVSLLERLTLSPVETLELSAPLPAATSHGFTSLAAPEPKQNRTSGKLGVKANAYARLAAIALGEKDPAAFEKRLQALRGAPLAGKVCDPFGAAMFPPCQLVPPSEAERLLTERAKR
ncbi:MAG: hypothetical protein QM765_32645 [Myxococcales bacterium]